MYASINHAWYDLKQGGKVAHGNLVEHFEKYGYVQAGKTNGLFKHIKHNIKLMFVADDFSIKYVNKADVHHLIKVMKNTPLRLILTPNNTLVFTLIGTTKKRTDL